MAAPTYIGVDLCGEGIALVTARWRSPAEGDPLAPGKESAAADRTAADLWEALYEALDLGDGSELDAVVSDGFKRLVRAMEPWRGACNRAVSPHHDPEDRIAVAYPAGMPAIVRRALPSLFGIELKPQGGLPAGSPLSGIEAPAALALEAVARRVAAVPSTLVAVTGRGSAREASVVRLERGRGDAGDGPLEVAILATTPLGLPLDESRVARLRRQLVGPSAEPSLIQAGPDDGGEAAWLARQLVIDPDRLRPLEDRAVALGAIRYAGTLRGRPLIAPDVAAVKVSGCTAEAVGVIGRIGAGPWAWAPLFPAGTPLPTPAAAVVSDAPGPRSGHDLILAETSGTGPVDVEPTWLAAREWPGVRLRIHEIRTASFKPAALAEPRHVWNLQLPARNPREPWGLLRWELHYLRPPGP